MIRINLLPEGLRPKEVKFIIPPELFLLILLSIFGLLVIIHLYLGSQFLFKALQYRSLNKRWMQFESQRQKAEEWKEKYAMSSEQSQRLNNLIVQRVTISDKLQVLSKTLPNGIWFNHLNFSKKGLRLEGSVISLKKDQMTLLNLFLGQLNQDKRFLEDFIHLELGRMNMRTLGGYPIMDFIVEGNLK